MVLQILADPGQLMHDFDAELLAEPEEEFGEAEDLFGVGGEFFVEESIRLQSYDVGAPFALALSARSDVLQEFDGGPGQIALHGLDNVGGVLGTATSHGCVRLADASMRWLVTRVGPGVPVTVT